MNNDQMVVSWETMVSMNKTVFGEVALKISED